MNVDSDQPPVELCGEKPAIEQWHYISTGQTARISFTTSDKTVGAQVSEKEQEEEEEIVGRKCNQLCFTYRAFASYGLRYRTPGRVHHPLACSASPRTTFSARQATAYRTSCAATVSRTVGPATIVTNCIVSRE